MAIWARSSSTSEKPDSTSLAEAALLCVLADLATSQPRTEATGRSAGGMLPPVPPVPMVLQVCFRSPDWGTGFSNSLAAALPCSKSAPVCGYALENTTKHFKHFIIYILWICWCVAACISHSRVNGKFPDGLTSVLPHLFSIPLSSPPPVRLFSCLTPVFVSSSEGIENTTCHRLFGGLFLVLHGGMFIIPSLSGFIYFWSHLSSKGAFGVMSQPKSL